MSPQGRAVVSVSAALSDGVFNGTAWGEISGSETDVNLDNNSGEVTSWGEAYRIYLPLIVNSAP